MLTLAVVIIFSALIAVIVWSAAEQAPQPRPIRLHRDETTLHHSRNLPGPGAD